MNIFLYLYIGCTTEKNTDTSVVIPEPTEEPIIEDTADTSEPEDTAEPESTECAPPLVITPQDSFVAPFTPMIFFTEGGSGSYTYELEGNSESASISSSGEFQSGAEGGEYTVIVRDRECDGEAQTTISVSDGLSVLPASAKLLPQTQISMDILGSSGDHTCTMVSSVSGGTVEDCVYHAGTTEGIDVLRIEDNQTEQAVSVAYIVQDNIQMDLWGSRYLIPINESIQLHAQNGSGHFDVSSYDEEILQIEGTQIQAIEKGKTQATVQDRYTGMTQDISIEVFPLHAYVDDSIFVSSDADTQKYTVIADKDINGDGIFDAVLAFPEHHYSNENSGFVSIHLGNSNGIDENATQVISENYIYDLQENDLFGHSVVAEDFDQDGFLDLAVGSRFADRVYVYYNTGDPLTPFSDHPELTISDGLQDGSGDQFGYSLVSCDVNGDGWLDLIGGAPAHTAEKIVASGLVEYEKSGAIRAYLGSETGFDSTFYIERVGEEQDENGDWLFTENLKIGSLLEGGDLNGDGYCDIITNTYTDSVQHEDHKNYVQVYLGTEDGLSEFPNGIISHWKPNTGKDYIAGVYSGDLNSDGQDELFLTWRTSNNSHDLEHQISLAMFQDIDINSASTSYIDWDQKQWSLFSNEVYDIGHHIQLSDVDGDAQNDLVFSSRVSYRPTIFVISGHDIQNDTYPGYCTTCYGNWTPENREEYIWSYKFDLSGRISGLSMHSDIDGDSLLDAVMIRDDDNSTGGKKEHPYIISSLETKTPLDYEGISAGYHQGISSGFLDIDGDGYEELIVSSPGQQESNLNLGEIISFDEDEDGYISEHDSILQLDTTSLERIGRYPIRSIRNNALRMSTKSDFDGDGYQELAFVSSLNTKGLLTIYRTTENGLEEAPYCISDIQRYSISWDRYQGRLIGGWDLNQDGLEDYVLGSRFFNGEHGGIHILYGNDNISGNEEESEEETTPICDFDISFQGWRYGGGLGSDFSLGYIDGDDCPDLVVSEPYLDTDKDNSGAIHILWGTGENCRSQSEFSSFYHPLELITAGGSLSTGVDLNEDGHDDVVYTQGREGIQKTFILDGAALSLAPTTELTNNRTPEGPLYPDPWHFYDIISDYIMNDIIHQGDARIELFEDSNGTKWLAFGKYSEDMVEMYRYDNTNNSFEDIPHIVIRSDSNNTNWKGDFGVYIQPRHDSVVISAPRSNLYGPNIGAFQIFSIIE